MVANVLWVRCPPPVKGLGATDTTVNKFVLLLLYDVVAAEAAAAIATPPPE